MATHDTLAQKLLLGLAVLLVALLGAAPAAAQNENENEQDPNEPSITIDDETGDIIWAMDETDGYSVPDFVKVCQDFTQKNFTYDEQEFASNPKKISWLGPRRIKKGEFFSFFQTMLLIRGFALIPRGSPDDPMWEVVSMQGQKRTDISSAAITITAEQVPDYASQTGVQVLTTVDLEHINATVATNALRPFFAQSGGTTGFQLQIGNAGSPQSMLLQGFGPQVYAAYRVIKLVDQPIPQADVRFAVVPLEYAAAEEITPHLEDILNDPVNNRPQAQAQGDPTAQIQLKIVPLISQNAIVLSGSKQQILDAQELIANLDLPTTSQSSDVHVVPLENVKAEDLRETLRDFLDQDQNAERAASQSAGTTPVRQQRNTVIQFHEDTNSLLISGTASKYKQLVDLINQLDKRQPQVLIEAAVVELATNDVDRFGVELGLIDLKENGDFTRGFGYTAFGQSTFQDTDDNSIPDTRLPDFDNPLQGLTGGIISGDDFAIPVLVNMLAQDERANILSLPSVLVNNNGDAVVSAFESRPTQTNTQNASTAVSGVGAPRDAGITLNISPSISSNNYLRLGVRLEVSRFTGAFDPNSVTGGGASVNRIIQTEVTMPSNDTMVIGGVVEDRESFNDSGIPILKDIPILGWLFKTQTTENTKTNLYFFVTPRILDEKRFDDLREISARVKLEAERYIGTDRMKIVDRKWTGNEAGATPILESDAATTEDLDSQGNFEFPFYMRRNMDAKAGIADNPEEMLRNSVPLVELPGGARTRDPGPRSPEPNGGHK